MNAINISNEEQALDLLNQIKKGLDVENTSITFDNWPKVVITLKGKNFDGSIPTRIMPPILKLQKEINHIYAKVKYGIDSDKNLTQQDRQDAELVVKIEKGSSIFEVDLGIVLNNVINQIVGKMTTTEIMTIVLGAGFIYTANSMWKNYLNNQARKHEMDVRVDVSKEETKRIEMISELAKDNITLNSFNKSMDGLREDILKKMREEDELVFDKKTVLKGGQAKGLVKRMKVEPIEIRIDDIFRIISVQSGKIKGGYKVLVENINTKENLQVSIPADTLSEEQKAKLQDGEWNKKPMHMQINASKLRGQINKAVLIEAGLK